VVAEFQRNGQENTADPASERRLLSVSQPFPNHNGGMIAFSPRDGFLYIGMGDGGSGGDPQGNGQNLDTLLGKMLRIDVDGRGAGEYGIPAGNMTGAGVRPEIWSYGLRNPWRFSFDSNGDLYIADVGQGDIEEVNYEPAGAGGRNYGWNTMEGSECFEPLEDCDRDGITLPVAEYDHDAGNSITGGFVYRGQAIPELRGVYFYADYTSGLIGALRIEDGALVGAKDITSSINPDGVSRITTFGVDAQGEVYLLTGGGNGGLYRIEAR
jgi:glucose/arabinose dehydrogenase